MDIRACAAIVTGGASGLGGATARMLAAGGARVTVFDLDGEAGRTTATAIGGRFTAVDVTDEAAVAAAVAQAEEAHGVARILVNCAGVAPVGRLVARDGAPMSTAAFRRAIDVNLVGSFTVAAQVAARLVVAAPIGEERGVFVNTASVAAFDGQIGQLAYAASKAGVAGMTLPLARDLAQHLVRVMTIAPGVFLTPMMTGLPQAAQDSLGAQVPHPSRLGRPEEYAALVEAIIGNPMLNGEVIRMAPR